MATATLVGSTGLVGSRILEILSHHPSFARISAFTRKNKTELPFLDAVNFDKTTLLVEPDSATWPSMVPKDSTVFFSALGTTRAAVNSLEEQRQVDYHLNLDLAKAAFQEGTKIYVLVSSVGANAASWFHYPKMKGELERDVSVVGFEHTVILRPAVILGDRESLHQKSLPLDKVIRSVTKGVSSLSSHIGNHIGNKAEDIAAAAIAASLFCRSNNRPDKKASGVWILGPKDIAILAAQFHEAKQDAEAKGAQRKAAAAAATQAPDRRSADVPKSEPDPIVRPPMTAV